MSLRAKCQDLKCQDHMSWAREEGVLLVGGTENSDTEAPSAEFVSWDGKRSEVMFNLSVTHRSVWYLVLVSPGQSQYIMYPDELNKNFLAIKMATQWF